MNEESRHDIQSQKETPVVPHNSKNGIYIVCVLLLVLFVGVGAYMLGTKATQLTPSKRATIPTVNVGRIIPTTAQEETANWKIYRDTKYNLTLRYPPSWVSGPNYITAPDGIQKYGYDINIAPQGRTLNHPNDSVEANSLELYVKQYAGSETAPVRIPESITKVITHSGVEGYKVQWQANKWSPNLKTYTTFFVLPTDKTLLLHIDGSENRNVDIYNKIILYITVTDF